MSYTGKISADYINYELNNAMTLLIMGYSRDMSKEEISVIMSVTYKVLEQLKDNVRQQDEKIKEC